MEYPPEAPPIAQLLQPLRRYLKTIALIAIVVAALLTLWLFFPWPGKLLISVIELDTGEALPLPIEVIVSNGGERTATIESGTVTELSVPSRVPLRITAMRNPPYASLITTTQVEPWEAKELILELSKEANASIEMPSRIIAPQTCSIKVPIALSNHGDTDLQAVLLIEGDAADPSYLARIDPSEAMLSARSVSNFTLSFTPPIRAEEKERILSGAIRLRGTTIKSEFEVVVIARAHYDVWPSEIRCPEAGEATPCKRWITVSNKGETALPIIVEWLGDEFKAAGGAIAFLDLPPQPVIEPEGKLTFGVSISPGTGKSLAQIATYAAAKGCSLKQVIITANP